MIDRHDRFDEDLVERIRKLIRCVRMFPEVFSLSMFDWKEDKPNKSNRSNRIAIEPNHQTNPKQ